MKSSNNYNVISSFQPRKTCNRCLSGQSSSNGFTKDEGNRFLCDLPLNSDIKQLTLVIMENALVKLLRLYMVDWRSESERTWTNDRSTYAGLTCVNCVNWTAWTGVRERRSGVCWCVCEQVRTGVLNIGVNRVEKCSIYYSGTLKKVRTALAESGVCM